MKLSLECSVKGRVKIGRQLKVVNGLKEYLLIPDDKGWLLSIKTIKKVETPKKYSARWEPGEGKVNATLVIEGDDWIVDPTAQQELCAMIDTLVAHLQMKL